jgi:hypothetical protein
MEIPYKYDTSLYYLNTVLFSLIGNDDLVVRWWKNPNKAFDNRTPEDTYKTDKKLVVDYILGQLNGDYS